jgi:Skp family chaperone for outer membrane proteins
MKKAGWFAGLAMTLAAMGGVVFHMAPVQAQGNGGNRPVVYCINVDTVLRENTKFKSQREAIKKEIEEKGKIIDGMKAEFEGKIKALRQLNKPEDRDAAERAANEMKFDIEKKQRQFAMELVEKESKMFNAVYREMTDLLKAYCEKTKIFVVLRVSNEMADPAVPDSIPRMLGREVVYYHPNLDLTETIKEALNSGAPAAN